MFCDIMGKDYSLAAKKKNFNHCMFVMLTLNSYSLITIPVFYMSATFYHRLVLMCACGCGCVRSQVQYVQSVCVLSTSYSLRHNHTH